MECRDFQYQARGMVPARIRPALAVLRESLEYAEQTGSDRWEFAVEIDQLAALGLSRNDFRWLVRKQLVEHRREVTLEQENGRHFAASGDLTFTDRTCFVLSERGCQLDGGEPATRLPSVELESPLPSDGHSNCLPSAEDNVLPVESHVTPRWDSAKRMLCVNGTLVKRFKWSAANQEAILSAFEEEGWPPRIDDPLSPHPEQDAKRRLSDTIKCLNRKQTNPLLHFRGDGAGEGVVWEWVQRREASCQLFQLTAN